MQLAHPYWLLALILLPLIVLGVVLASGRRKKRWSQLVAGRLRESLIRRGNPIPIWLSFSFLLAAIALIILGLTGPRGDGGTETEKSAGRNLLFALDLSRSMSVEDTAPDRLSLAKLVIYDLLEEMPNDRIGLIGFAGEPYLYAPLTIDHSAVRETVEQMDTSWPTLGGSDLGSALRLGIETLNKTNQRNKAMVLLTDGEMHEGDLDRMISEAREAGVYIIAVGVGTEDGGYVPNQDFPGNRMLDRNGNPVLSRLDGESLSELAGKTGGSFAIAGSGADIARMVKTAIAGLEAFEIEGRERKVYIEFYQWLVSPAVLLLIASLIAGTRWKGLSPAGATAVLTVVAFLLASDPGQAQESAGPKQREMERYQQLAKEALLNGRRARYRLGEADAAYRLQDWDRASRAYSAALMSKQKDVLTAAHHGIGNTLFQKGWLRFLDSPYTADSPEGPGMERFEQAVREKLQKLRGGEPEQEEQEEEEPQTGSEDAFTYDDIRHSILDWTDSVRHFRSVLDMQSDHQGALQNHELTLIYLRKLRELLEDDRKQNEELMSQMQSTPRPGDGDQKQEGEDDKQNDQNRDQQQPGENNQPSDQGKPKDAKSETDPDGQPDPDQNPRERDNTGKEEEPELRPGETPEENARRRLRESADSEKGPLTPGRIKFQKPEKDW